VVYTEIKMIIESKVQILYKVEMSSDEAEFLRDMLQNPLVSLPEPNSIKKRREALFEVFNQALIAHSPSHAP
jgi:hypothetical protein